MTDRADRGYSAGRGGAANDNGGAEARVRAAVTVLARLIGRRMAREQYDRRDAANENGPAKEAGER